MDFGLSKVDLRVLALLCTSNSLSVKDIAVKLNISNAVVSRSVRSLFEQDFIVFTRSRRKLVSLSGSSHASSFKVLVSFENHIDFSKVLDGGSLRVLSGLLYCNSVREVSEVTSVPEVTVRRVLMKLRYGAIVFKKGVSDYVIRLDLVRNFVEVYCNYFLNNKIEGLNGSLICRGPLGLLYSKDNPLDFLVLTGTSVFHEYGIQLILTRQREYYFNLFKEKTKLSLEDVLVHALTRSVVEESSRSLNYVLLVLNKNFKKINKNKFLIISKKFGIKKEGGNCLKLIEDFKKGKEWSEELHDEFAKHKQFFSRTEFQELVNQYE